MLGARSVTPGSRLLVRTRRSLMRSGTLAVAASAVPLFAVLYWLSISQGSWRRVFVANLAFLALWAFAWFRFRGVYVQVDAETVTKQSFLVRTAIPKKDVARILISETYRTSSPETVPQFLALDADGTRLMRLRGYFWRREDMIAIAAAAGVDPVIDPDPVSRREYYRANPGVAYWYENKPWLKPAGIVIAIALAAALIGWLLTAIGSSTFLIQVG